MPVGAAHFCVNPHKRDEGCSSRCRCCPSSRHSLARCMVCGARVTHLPARSYRPSSLIPRAPSPLRGELAGLRVFVTLAIVALVVVGAGTADAKDFDQTAICAAIARGETVRLWYRPGEGERTVQPRYLGYTKAGDIILNGLQLSGFSESGGLPGSRNFRLDRTTNIAFGGSAIPRPMPGRPSPSTFATMICRIP